MHIHVNSTCSYCQICLSKRKKRPKHRCCILLVVIKLYICTYVRTIKPNLDLCLDTLNTKVRKICLNFFCIFQFGDVWCEVLNQKICEFLSFYVAIWNKCLETIRLIKKKNMLARTVNFTNCIRLFQYPLKIWMLSRFHKKYEDITGYSI